MKGACVESVFAKIKVNKTYNESIHNISKHAYYRNRKHITCYMVSILCFVSTGMFITQPTPWLAVVCASFRLAGTPTSWVI